MSIQLNKLSSKFYIYARGRWREVEMDTGCVSGFGRSNFVFLRGGRLVMAQQSKVLCALRLLAAGRASAAKDSCMLSKYTPLSAPMLRRRTKSPVTNQHHMIRSMNDQLCLQCKDMRFNNILKDTNTVATQYVSTADASNQVPETMISPHYNSNDNLVVPKKIDDKRKMPLRNKNGKFIKCKKINKLLVKNSEAEQQLGTGDIEASATTVINKNALKIYKKKTERVNNKRQQLTTQETNICGEKVKELVIEDDVVDILRRYLEKHNTDVDLKRFDRDDVYKEQIFFQINPLVVVERCPQIKVMLNLGYGNCGVCIKDFMNSLGLQAIQQRSPNKRYKTRASTSQSTNSYYPHSHTQDNKENESVQNVTRKSHKSSRILKDSVSKKSKLSERLRSPPAKRAKKMSPQRKVETIEQSYSSSSDSSLEEYLLRRSATVGSQDRVLRSRSSIGKAMAKPQTVVTASPTAKASIAAKAPTAAKSPTAAKVPTAAKATTAAKSLTATKAPTAATAPTITTAPSTARTTVDRHNSGLDRNRVYSPLEDQAIISWVRQSDRARFVNGNRLWQELQREHTARTGIARTWHSLRNRYLRHILPMLSSLAPPPVAVQLRAAAATGEIKNRNQKKPVQNSMLVLPSVRSAWAPRRARIVSSLSSTPTASPTRIASPTSIPEPKGSSTPTDEHRLATLHNSRERTKIRKSHSKIKLIPEPKGTSEDDQRVLRPRPSEAHRRSRNPDDSESLRERPKKRRLYNPQNVI